MHIYIDQVYCLEVLVTEGEAEEVLDFVSRVRVMRGVQQVKYIMVPLATE